MTAQQYFFCSLQMTDMNFRYNLLEYFYIAIILSEYNFFFYNLNWNRFDVLYINYIGSKTHKEKSLTKIKFSSLLVIKNTLI